MGQVHADGEIWSRALWDIRNELGGVITDTLVLEHHFSLPGGATMTTAALEMISADANLYSGANEDTLRDHFCTRGILSEETCSPLIAAPIITYPTGGDMVPSNSVVDVTWETNGAPADATYTAEYISQCTPSAVFSDDFEGGAGNWTVSHGSGSQDWGLSSSNPQSGSNAMFADDPTEISDQYLTMNNPVVVTSGMQLSFWHDYNTEPTYDGGVVEVSVDGGNEWLDLGIEMVENGYNGTIDDGFSSPIAGREAFTGSSGGYVQTLVNLGALEGQTALIRFRMASDSSIGGNGWTVDDVLIGSLGTWTSIGTSAAGATSMPWNVGSVQSDDYCLRLTARANGFTAATTTTPIFSVGNGVDIFADGFEAGNVSAWSSSVP